MHDVLSYLAHLFIYDKTAPLTFVQFNFWAFFLIVFACYCYIHSCFKSRSHRFRLSMRNGYLAFVSFIFYYKTSGLYLVLLIFSTAIGWLLGIGMDRVADRHPSRSTPWRKTMMIFGVIVNLFMLFYFKYAYFFTDIYNNMFTTDHQVVNHFAKFAQFTNNVIGIQHFDVTDLIIIPVGISFFTFQNISYIVDVYKQKIRHAGNLLDFAFYTSFFPQLVAGPIIRADQFVPQLYKPYFLSRRQFGIAVFWILNGLLKKIILSDYLAVNFVDRVFYDPTLYTGFENLSALFLYSLQVYADFSGYTDIAIGVAMLMGFYLPKNFNSPYKATNPAGFWKRWHISLSNWLKDYLYIPLGGNRRASAASYIILGGMLVVVALMARTVWVTIAVSSVIGLLIAVYLIFPRHRHEFRTNVNNMDTMLLGGMWHGASFNFITWGGLNGLGILAYKWWKKQGSRTRIVATELLFFLFLLADIIWTSPALNLFTVWSGILCIGTAIRYLIVNPLISKYRKSGKPQPEKAKIHTVWNIFLTFVFITFTRLFFRSGSNLPPDEANELAWSTAKKMVNSIGGKWDLNVIPDIIVNYRKVFIVFVIGMVIHWLPDNFKRRYRLWFTSMPLWLMAIVVVAAVFIAYQFITADLQPFIYFQF